MAERVGGLSVIIIRQAGKSGSLYGSVSARDIADGATAGGLTINRSQVVLEHPIKTLGLSQFRVSLHPEVSIPVTVNVARSPEEAERQARGERATGPGGRRRAGPDRREHLRRRRSAARVTPVLPPFLKERGKCRTHLLNFASR